MDIARYHKQDFPLCLSLIQMVNVIECLHDSIDKPAQSATRSENLADLTSKWCDCWSRQGLTAKLILGSVAPTHSIHCDSHSRRTAGLTSAKWPCCWNDLSLPAKLL